MAGGFTKLFSSIVTSSIWCQDDVVLRVWIAMLATCDSDGIVEGSVPGFASMSRVTNEQMERAIEVLSSPDEYSRTKDKDGRRIEAIDGGWQIVNYRAYRDKGQAKEGSRAPYMRNRRASKAHPKVATDCNALHDDATRGTEAEAEAEKITTTALPQPEKKRAKRQPRIQKLGDYPAEMHEAVSAYRELMRECRTDEIRDRFPGDKQFIASSLGANEAVWSAWREKLNCEVDGVPVSSSDILAAVGMVIDLKRSQAKGGISLAIPMLPTLLRQPLMVDALVRVRKVAHAV